MSVELVYIAPLWKHKHTLKMIVGCNYVLSAALRSLIYTLSFSLSYCFFAQSIVRRPNKTKSKSIQ